MIARLKKFRHDNKGTTSVEFAVIAALLLLILLGIVEFGFIFLQEHYVANAAREGLRIGVRANNYDCFNETPVPPATACSPDRDRVVVIRNQTREYLRTLYGTAVDDPAKTTIDVISKKVTISSSPPVEKFNLTVEVGVNNFFPRILSGFVPGMSKLDQITFSTTMEYEDKDEFIEDTTKP